MDIVILRFEMNLFIEQSDLDAVQGQETQTFSWGSVTGNDSERPGEQFHSHARRAEDVPRQVARGFVPRPSHLREGEGKSM